MQYLRKIRWFGRIQHIPQQSQCVWSPALDMFCITLCGHPTKKFGDPGLGYCSSIAPKM